MKNPTVELIHSGGEAQLGFDGLLGMDALRRFTLTLDAGNNRLWVKANGAVDQAFRYNRSGIVNGPVQGRAGIVAVIPDSPAEKAGLRVGDVLLHPHGETISDLMWQLSDAPGTVIEIQVERNGQRIPARLVLAELI
jgi:C-terminal processing protease CtpA/Prc